MKLDVLPDAGVVVISHPANERAVEDWCKVRGFNYMLTDWMPEDKSYLMDVAAFFGTESSELIDRFRIGEGRLCSECGGLLVRTGTCYTCSGCGSTDGCS
jgi:hypothetical protein